MLLFRRKSTSHRCEGSLWLVEHGIHPARLFRAPIWCPSGGGGTGEADGTVAESLVGRSSTRKRTVARSIGRVSTRFGEGGGKLDCRRARGVLNHFARESKARTGEFLRRKLISDHGLISSYDGQQGTANGQYSWAFFRDAQGFRQLDAGSYAGFTSSRPARPSTLVLQFSLFLRDMWP